MIRFVDGDNFQTGGPMKKPIAGGVLAAVLGLALATLAGSSTDTTAQSAPGAPTVISPQPQDPNHRSYMPPDQRGADPYAPPPPRQSYGEPSSGESYGQQPYDTPPPRADSGGTYSNDEITDAGHRFFGRVSTGLAQVIEYAFQKAGRPNGYILGEEAGGAFVAGLRYGEGKLFTKNAGEHKVFWQGPSIGYDFGAEGSKTMILVYNLQRTDDIYATYGGVDGSAYFIGGVGVTFQKHEHVTLAPIRSGIGLRLGANIGYLKYTRRPTWNPF